VSLRAHAREDPEGVVSLVGKKNPETGGNEVPAVPEAALEAVRQALQKHPGLNRGQLRKVIEGVPKNQRSAAIEALIAAGEIEDRGARGFPSLHLVLSRAS
jgi:hypothetical protein